MCGLPPATFAASRRRRVPSTSVLDVRIGLGAQCRAGSAAAAAQALAERGAANAGAAGYEGEGHGGARVSQSQRQEPVPASVNEAPAIGMNCQEELPALSTSLSTPRSVSCPAPSPLLSPPP